MQSRKLRSAQCTLTNTPFHARLRIFQLDVNGACLSTETTSSRDEGRHQASFYSHLVDANFTYFQAVNETPIPVVIQRRARIGTLYEADLPMACVGS